MDHRHRSIRCSLPTPASEGPGRGRRGAEGSAARRPFSGGRAPGAAGLAVVFALAVLASAPAALSAQPATERTPNLSGPWVTSPWNLHFQFAHRFEVVGQDADVSDIFGDGSITNYPTFDVALGLPADLMTGFRYSSNSVVVGNVNEWQPYLKWAPIRGAADGALSLAATAAWNGAASSVDGELTARTRLGSVYGLAAVRGYSRIFDQPTSAVGLAGGLGVRLNRYLAVAADVSDLVSGVDAPAAWSAGLQIGIPHTPHTLSLQATNVYSGTLQGTATGDRETTFWGFEFTVPFSGFARWGKIFGGEDDDRSGRPARGGDARAPETARVVEVPISSFSFAEEELRIEPGTTVRWVNKDPVAHTTTSDEGLWDSALLGPGESFSRTFRQPGRHAYHCTPHPFMEGAIVVTSDEEENRE